MDRQAYGLLATEPGTVTAEICEPRTRARRGLARTARTRQVAMEEAWGSWPKTAAGSPSSAQDAVIKFLDPHFTPKPNRRLFCAQGNIQLLKLVASFDWDLMRSFRDLFSMRIQAFWRYCSRCFIIQGVSYLLLDPWL